MGLTPKGAATVCGNGVALRLSSALVPSSVPRFAQPRSLAVPRWLLVMAVVVVVLALILLLEGVPSRGTSPPAGRVSMREVSLPEGVPLSDALRRIAAATHIPLRDLQAAAERPESLDLPVYAKGQLEGFLFPTTYEVESGTSAAQLLTRMVDQFEDAADGLGLARRARALGRSPYQIVTMASLVESVTHSDPERAGVARVIANRLAARMPLQFDSTVDYIRGESARRRSGAETPYSTYRNRGLPPTPIGSPGLAALDAVLSPTPGDYRYFLTAHQGSDALFTSSVTEYLRARKIGPREEGTVTDILDGDSILVRLGSRTEEVRLIGVDSPERGECYYAQSRAATTRWLHHKPVTLRFDRQQGSSDGVRLFAYVYAHDTLINLKLIRWGYAHERAYGHSYQRRSNFQAAMRKPWRQGTGLWGACTGTTP